MFSFAKQLSCWQILVSSLQISTNVTVTTDCMHWSNTDQILWVEQTHDSVTAKWQKLCSRWSTAMEQSASRTASVRHRTGGISMATETVFVYVRHRHLVTFVFEHLTNIRLLLLLPDTIKKLPYIPRTVIIKVCVHWKWCEMMLFYYNSVILLLLLLHCLHCTVIQLFGYLHSRKCAK